MTTGCLEWGAAGRPRAGQVLSGDRHVVTAVGEGVLVGAVDGLGHGPEARRAALAALATVQAFAHEDLPRLMSRCHEALAGTRGAVMSLARFAAAPRTLAWLAVGNVAGWLKQSARDSACLPLLARAGLVGHGRLPALHPTVLPLAPDDTLVVVTDGIAGDVTQALRPSVTPASLARQMLQEFGRPDDDALVVIARYRGVAEGRA